MQIVKTATNQPSLYWLFNTPYAVKIDGVKTTRCHARKNAPETIVVRLIDGSECTFNNQPLPQYAPMEHLALAVPDGFGEVKWMTFIGTDGKPVALKQVYEYIAEYEIYGYAEARNFSMFTAVCNGASTAVLCEQWGITRSTLCMNINRLIRKSRQTLAARREPAQFEGKGTSVVGLREHPKFWLKWLEQLMHHVKS